MSRRCTELLAFRMVPVSEEALTVPEGRLPRRRIVEHSVLCILGVAVVAATLHPVAALARQIERTREYTGTVSRVVDGDTIVVGKGRKAISVRLRCVDTPEIAHGERRDEPYGREAQALTRTALAGKSVRLVYHTREPLDRYGRLLAYVFLDDGTLFNAGLVRQGLARVTRFKCLYRRQIKALEAEAKQKHLGMWSGR